MTDAPTPNATDCKCPKTGAYKGRLALDCPLHGEHARRELTRQANEQRFGMFGTVADLSGENEEGGTKNDDGKDRWDLVPDLRPLVEVSTLGAGKYGDRNWEKGMPWGRIFAAMMRHAWAWWRGEQRDPVDGQHHLASVAWCALALIEYEERGLGEDTRP